MAFIPNVARWIGAVVLPSGLPSGGAALGQSSWSKVLPGVGTFSSSRGADLNRDGVGDIILGAGRLEFQACDSAIVALDGRANCSGEIPPSTRFSGRPRSKT